MKKLLTLLLTLFMIFTLVGCSDKQQEDIPTIVEQSQIQEVIQEDTQQEETFEVIEEVITEEPKEEIETVSEDITNMYFWVVFFDKYGNELQRETLKYGTVPEYKGWLPEGFDKWIYKKSGKDVGSFKSITGNTYYQAVCHDVPHSSGGSSESNPSPTPQINEYGFYYNANYHGPLVNGDIIFTEVDYPSISGSKFAIINLPAPLSVAGTFPYSVSSNIISMNLGIGMPVNLTIDENSLNLDITVPTFGNIQDSFVVTEQNINIGITNSYFLYKGSTLISTIDPSITSLSIPSGFSTIGDGFLSHNTSIVNLTIPSSVQYIGDSAFDGCSNLSTINLSEGLLSIGGSAFEHAPITSISIPSSVNTIGTFAFYGCNSLQSISFNSNSNVSVIERRAFSESALESIIFPNNLSSIDDEAFTNCTSLTSIEIPVSVTSIGKDCFAGCDSLNSINYNGTMAQWNTIIKGQYWNSFVLATYVQCSDGQVSF